MNFDSFKMNAYVYITHFLGRNCLMNEKVIADLRDNVCLGKVHTNNSEIGNFRNRNAREN